MFERFTETARAVVVQAQFEARELQHEYVGTEHLLLALLEDPAGSIAVALRDSGVDQARVRDLLPGPALAAGVGHLQMLESLEQAA